MNKKLKRNLTVVMVNIFIQNSLSLIIMDLVSLSDVKDINDPLNKVQAGLKTDSGMVPLKSVHIRAQLIDLAAKVCIILIRKVFIIIYKVVVLQSYKNENVVPIEAKYVFPLDEMAAGKVDCDTYWHQLLFSLWV